MPPFPVALRLEIAGGNSGRSAVKHKGPAGDSYKVAVEAAAKFRKEVWSWSGVSRVESEFWPLHCSHR